MKIFDGHIHLDSDSAHFAAPAAEAEGAERWALLSLSQHHDDPVQNLAVLLAKALSPDRCFGFFGLDHPVHGRLVPDPLDQVKTWRAAGFDGLKLIETKPNCQKATGVRLDEARFDPMFDYLEREQIPVLWHNGDPATFWDPKLCPAFAVENGWSYVDGTFLPLSELYSIVERVLDRHPLLKVTFAHFYFVSDDPAHAERMMERYPNVRFDITPGSEMYGGFSDNPEFFRPFFLRYADRIQLGTDTLITAAPHPPVIEGDARFAGDTMKNILRFLMTSDEFTPWGVHVKAGFALPEKAVEQIVSGTMTSFLGDRPVRIDPDSARRACSAALERCSGTQVSLARDLIAEIEDLLREQTGGAGNAE